MPDVTSIMVLSLNAWYNATAVEDGLKKTTNSIRESGANIVALSEAGHAARALAASLGDWYVAYVDNHDCAVISTFKITRLYYQSPWKGIGARIQLSPGQFINVWSVHLAHHPYGPYDINKGMSKQEVLAGETGRVQEIEALLEAQEANLGDHCVLTIIAGDFNAPSHHDWTVSNKGHDIEWPVSTRVECAGFTDSYRQTHSDISRHTGETWSPKERNVAQDRIDFIYFKGANTRILDSRVWESLADFWASDHRAVRTELAPPCGTDPANTDEQAISKPPAFSFSARKDGRDAVLNFNNVYSDKDWVGLYRMTASNSWPPSTAYGNAENRWDYVKVKAGESGSKRFTGLENTEYVARYYFHGKYEQVGLGYALNFR